MLLCVGGRPNDSDSRLSVGRVTVTHNRGLFITVRKDGARSRAKSIPSSSADSWCVSGIATAPAVVGVIRSRNQHAGGAISWPVSVRATSPALQNL